MSYLEVGGRRYSLDPGETVIGSDPDGQIVLGGGSVAAQHALVRATADGQISIHRAKEDVEVLVNGVRLGAQPTPLLHGDKVVIGGHELRFGDERRGGSTQFMNVDQALGGSRESPQRPAQGAGTVGGRLVSLVDGREYSVGAENMVIGRSTECDVVLTSRNVSRRHAEIQTSPMGYVLLDRSTNGTFVNGERIHESHTLARGDVIRVGEEEFRFYAEQAEPEGASDAEAAERTAIEIQAVKSPAAQAKPAPPKPPAPEPAVDDRDPFLPDPSKARGEGRARDLGQPAPPGAVHQLRDTLFGVPGVKVPGLTRGTPPEVERPEVPPKPSAPPPERASHAPALANLVVRSGPLKGTRFAIRVPVANIGRAEYNDVVIQDASVSTTHAKLQRREGIWVLVDLDSTNGTSVDGERIRGEVPIAPGAKVRFGNVEILFEPTDDSAPVEQIGGTQVLDAFAMPRTPPPGPRTREPEPAAPPPKPEWEEPPTPRSIERKEVAPPREVLMHKPEREPDHAGGTPLFTRLIWGLLVLVVLAVLIIVFAG